MDIGMLRHPYMSEEGETSPLDDGGQRQGASPPLNLHVGDEVRPLDAANTSQTLPPKGIDYPLLALCWCPSLREA